MDTKCPTRFRAALCRRVRSPLQEHIAGCLAFLSSTQSQAGHQASAGKISSSSLMRTSVLNS
eukprot:12430757-Karenia_brevis.AAC.1